LLLPNVSQRLELFSEITNDGVKILLTKVKYTKIGQNMAINGAYNMVLRELP